MEPMNLSKQEIFDRIASHLIAQGSGSTNAEGECVYRSPNGTSCAVGCLIPDELYNPDFEMNSVKYLPLGVREYLGLDNMEMLSNLQTIHDIASRGSYFLTDIREEMCHYAVDHNLNSAVFDV